MILNGKKVADDILHELKNQVHHLKDPRPPCLAFILVGNHIASQVYVERKQKACEKIGMSSKDYRLAEKTSQQELIQLIEKLNLDSNVDGILVQMPLPEHLHPQSIVEAITPQKDVDGFHPFNIGRLLLGYSPYFVPCTPLGIQELLVRSEISTSGKHIVVVGRSNIVGKPLAALLVQKNQHANATVTLAHSNTLHLEKITTTADILIAAIGSPGFIKDYMVKKGAVVIDVGISRHHQKIVGDVDFEKVSLIASHITPVPGGVGPMTIAMLLSNTLKSYKMKF